MRLHNFRDILYTIIAIFSATSIAAAKVPLDRDDSIRSRPSFADTYRWSEIEALSGIGITCGVEAQNGTLWFGRSWGVVSYNGWKTDSFDFPDWPAESAKSILVAQNGDLYLLTDRFLALLRNGTWTRLLELTLNRNSSSALAETKDGSVWLASRSGLLRFKGGEAQPVNLPQESIDALVVDTQNRLWLSYDRKSKLAVHSVDENGKLSEELIHFPMNRQRAGGAFAKLHSGRSGDIWYQISGKNVMKVFRFTELEKDHLELSDTFSINQISTNLAEGENGNLLLIGRNALTEFKDGDHHLYRDTDYPIPNAYGFIVPMSGSRILIAGQAAKTFIVNFSEEKWKTYENLNLSCEDSSGKLWFFSDNGGVTKYDPRTEHWKQFASKDGVIEGPNRIFESSDQTIWVSGMHEGIASVSWYKNGEWTRDDSPNVATLFSHLSVCETSDGYVLFGSGTPPGSDSMFKHPGGYIAYKLDDYGNLIEKIHIPKPERPASIVEQPKQGLWYGSRSLQRGETLSNKRPEIVERFRNHWIDHLALDNQNNLWVAKWGAGVSRFDGKSWESFTERDGLISNQAIYIHTVRENDSLLVATSQGLSRFDGSTWTKKAIPGDFRFNREGTTIESTSDGAIWLNYSTRNRLVEIQLAESAHSKEHKTIRYQADRSNPETLITRAPIEAHEYGSTSLKWEGLDYWEETSTDLLEFSYRVDSEKWSPFTSTRELVLTGLSNGSHRFQVRSRDVDLNIDPTPATVDFQVIPILWKRPWFIVSSILLFITVIGLVYALYRTRIRHILAMESFKLDFFSKISHELRNPLAVIIGPTESLIKDGPNKDQNERLEMIRRNAHKMLDTVNQLLDFRKVELGILRYSPINGDIIAFLRQDINNSQILIDEKKLNLDLSFSHDSYDASFDAPKLQSLLDNLLVNAIKYTPEGGQLDISVLIKSNTDGPDILELKVSDNGIGIEKDKLNSVFEPYYRASSNQQSHSGHGIGLAYVKDIVRIYDGDLKIFSPPIGKTKGTCVQISIPIDPPIKGINHIATSVTEQATDSLPSNPVSNTQSQNSEQDSILVIEDNEDLRKFTVNQLGNHYPTIEAADGSEGLELAKTHLPSLIVSDIMMPKLDGLELCHQLKNTNATRHIPIILLTARGAKAHYKEGIEKGADDYFEKPIEIDKLLTRIDNLIQSRRQLRETFSQQTLIEPTEIAVTSSDQRTLRKAVTLIEENMRNEDFDVKAFTEMMAMSRVTLYRKLKGLTNLSPSLFIRSIRLKRAAQILKTGNFTVSETLEHIGILDASYFSRVFKKEYGVSPKDYAKKNAK
ncbi:response regulator [Puniceicoccaceae bacterium K14]|nr:response regulator [Puniceicoccaceae bacterium K14]